MKFQKISLLSLLCILFSANLLAVDGVVLINNATVMAAGGYPYSITQPGSYKLSGNLTVPDANTDAIQIKTDDVTLDLNGFIISGPEVCILGTYPVQCSAQSTALGYGVNAGANIAGRNNITVMNGTIRGMGAGAVILFGHGEVVDRVRAEGNAAFIPDLDGAIHILDGTVTRCTITGNAAHGILAFDFHSVGAFFALITQNSISFKTSVSESKPPMLRSPFWEMSCRDHPSTVALPSGTTCVIARPAEGMGCSMTVMGNSLNHNGYDGLVVRNGTVYGNNSIQSNTVIDVFFTTNATVYLCQNNNLCSNGKC